jgi:hypothetical protein
VTGRGRWPLSRILAQHRDRRIGPRRDVDERRTVSSYEGLETSDWDGDITDIADQR